MLGDITDVVKGYELGTNWPLNKTYTGLSFSVLEYTDRLLETMALQRGFQSTRL